MFSTNFSVSEKVTINKSIAEVFEVVSDFNTWDQWSPWVCQEKDCKTQVDGKKQELGHRHTWNGKRIGEGYIEIEKINAPQEIQYNLHFLKPWKSHAQVKFLLQEQEGGTEVSWEMKSSLPFFLFFMKKAMTAYISFDYERGLKMLKELLETGDVLSDTSITGTVAKEAFYYLGKRTRCAIKDMPQLMQQDFKSFGDKISQGEISEPQIWLSFYHKFDMVEGTCDFTSALGYEKEPQEVVGLQRNHVENHNSLQVVHQGSYENLGNAWATAMSYQRFNKAKAKKNLPCYEVYLNDPREVAPRELMTEINLPLK